LNAWFKDSEGIVGIYLVKISTFMPNSLTLLGHIGGMTGRHEVNRVSIIFHGRNKCSALPYPSYLNV